MRQDGRWCSENKNQNPAILICVYIIVFSTVYSISYIQCIVEWSVAFIRLEASSASHFCFCFDYIALYMIWYSVQSCIQQRVIVLYIEYILYIVRVQFTGRQTAGYYLGN